MPKVLQVNTTLNCSSTGRIAEQISLLASKQGWDCLYAHGGRYVAESSINSYLISSRLDNEIHAAKSIIAGKHGLGSYFATQRFVRWINSVKPDVIHLHNIHGYYLNYQILFEYLSTSDIPVVWTLHDCWPFTGHCTHFVEAGCNRWKSGCSKCPLLRYSYKTFIDRTGKNWQLKKDLFTSVKRMVVVPVSQWLAGVLGQSFLGEYPCQVIYNGIDLNTFNLGTLPKLDNKFKMIAVASGWDDSKGLRDYIELSKRLEEDEQIILVGVQKDIRNKLPSNIIAIESTRNQQELAALYQSADVVLSLSHAEAMGLTPVEGMACGLPAIVYDNTALPELITEEVGACVHTGDMRQLRNAISLIKSRGKCYYTSACRSWVTSRFDQAKKYQDYVDLYSEILK